jgi:multidrug efflux pump subunit AcrB
MSTLFLRRPRLLVLTLALVAVAGLSALSLLPRAEDPTLSDRVARVITRFPGATPERVESLVTDKLEEELLEVPEVHLLRSESRPGISVVVVEMADEVATRDLADVWVRVRAAIDDAEPLLPRGASQPVFEEARIEAFTLIAGLTWEDPDRPANLGLLRRQAEELRDVFRAVEGTGDVELRGAPPEEVRALVDPVRLTALGLSTGDVARAVRQGDAKVAAGRLSGGAAEVLLEVTGELDSLERIRNVPVREGADGRVVRLGDIARVERGVQDPAPEAAILDGKPGVAVAARMTRGQRVDLWSAKARGALEAYQRGLPASIRLEVIYDQSRYTEERLEGLGINLAAGAALVVLVLLGFFGWRAALLVGSALPLATLMVLTGMRALEIPVHQMSVTGLIIALGLLIDNAIVIVDEVQQRLRRPGATPAGAVSGSVRHLAVPLLGSTLTTALAFMPIVLLPGPAGEFVGAIAISVILALVSSLFLALTVIPALAGRLRIAGGEEGGAGEASTAPWRTAGFRSQALTERYRAFLDGMLRRPVLAVALAAVVPLLGYLGGTQLKEQFFPPADRDQFQIDMRLGPQASLLQTRAAADRAREVLEAHPEVTAVHWFVGRNGPKFYYNQMPGEDGSSHYGQALVQLRSPEGATALIRRVQRDLDAALPSAQVLVRQLEQGPPFDAPVELHLTGPDLDRLRLLGDEVRRVLAGVPQVTHTRTTLDERLPKLVLQADEERMRRAGLDPTEVAGQLQRNLDGAVGGTLLEGSDELPVRVQAAGSRSQLRRIESLGLKAPADPASGLRASVPLTAVGAVTLEPQLASVTRRNGQRSNTVQGFLQAGVLPADAVAAFQEALDASGFELPPGYSAQLGGESMERDRAVGNLLASVGLLLVLMAGTLVLAFDSFRQAALIALVGGLSGGLSMGALWVFGHPFGFMAIVGTMGLIGIAINDAIVVLAGLREDPAAAAGDPDAVREVVLRSTRHVLATTVTTVAGFAPLLVAGGSFWRPLATAIAGGVAGATLLALVFVPAGFLILIRLGMTCPLRTCAQEGAPAAGPALVAASA